MSQEDQPNHEGMHSVGSEPAWSESDYFNFVDPTSKVGMFTRMGFRPGDGWADALHVLYLEGSRVAFTYGRRDIGQDLAAYDGDLAVGGLILDCLAPHGEWSVSYAGQAQDIADGAVLLERSKLRPEGWFRPAHLEMSVRFVCSSPPHLATSDDPAVVSGRFGHFEQCGAVSGSLRLGDEAWTVNGFGVRDKSWGPRDWGASQRESKQGGDMTTSTPEAPAPFVNWFSMNFGADAALGGSCFRRSDGRLVGVGWIQRAGKTMGLEDVSITTEYAPGSILHRDVVLSAATEDGEAISMTGRVLNVCPTKVPMPGGATFINEGLAEFEWRGQRGYGIAEHWHAVRL